MRYMSLLGYLNPPARIAGGFRYMNPPPRVRGRTVLHRPMGTVLVVVGASGVREQVLGFGPAGWSEPMVKEHHDGQWTRALSGRPEPLIAQQNSVTRLHVESNQASKQMVRAKSREKSCKHTCGHCKTRSLRRNRVTIGTSSSTECFRA
jgi:hypothetical protein